MDWDPGGLPMKYNPPRALDVGEKETSGGRAQYGQLPFTSLQAEPILGPG